MTQPAGSPIHHRGKLPSECTEQDPFPLCPLPDSGNCGYVSLAETAETHVSEMGWMDHCMVKDCRCEGQTE